MKLPKTFFLYTTFIIPFLACTTKDSLSKSSQSFGRRDSILHLYNQAKKKEFPTKQRLKDLNNAYQLFISKKESDTSLLIDIHSLKNAIYSETKCKDSALFYAKNMLYLAHQKKDTSKIGKAYFKLAKYYNSQSKYDSAYYYFNASKEKYLLLNDSSQVGRKLMAMARILLDDNDYYQSETTSVEALTYLSPLKDKKYLASVYHNLSLASRNQFNYDIALEQINKAIKLAYSSQNRNLYLNSKALIYREQKEYNKATSLYDSLLISKSIFQNKKEYARVIDNLAFTQWLSNNSLNLEDKLLKALNIRQSENDIQGLIASNSHLMKYYFVKDTSKSIKHAHQLYKLTVQQNNTEDRLEALSFLKNLTSSKDKAIAYANLYIHIKDSITEARDQARIKYASMRYDSSEKEKKIKERDFQIAQQDLKSARDDRKILILLIIVILILSVGVFIYRYLKQKAKNARIEERHNTNKRLSKKLHDEVGNDLYYLLLQLQKVSGFASDHENLKILEGFDKVYDKVRDFSRDYNIQTGEEYGDELLSLLDSYGDDTTKIVTSKLKSNFWTEVSSVKKEELYWVLKELLTNMKKHSKATIVAVTFSKAKKQIMVNYTDNGIGVDLEQQISKNGLLNVENRMKEINGTITFDSKLEAGFRATIVFTP